MITIIDYGAGNLFSVKNALDFLGFESRVSAKADDIHTADKLILPGVGSFPDAMGQLRQIGLIGVIRREAVIKPFLGICLGMQVLFEKGFEFEDTEGLALIDGYVDKLEAPGQKIPHMGWDDVTIVHENALTKGVKDGDMVYFVHSYKAVTDEANISLSATYGQLVPALVHKGTVYGAQFHPEKSGEVGLGILRNFAAL
jgi:glutamine amidotransferase